MTDTRPCPYEFCRATVQVVWTKEFPGTNEPTVAMVAPHSLANPALHGRCPASLMKLPLDADSTRHLQEQARADQVRVNAWHEARAAHGGVPQNYASTPQGVIHLYCRTRHGPADPCPGVQNESQPVGEFGSHPADSPGWALGGREDEDVIPATEMVVPPLPQGVAGYKVGGAMAGADSTAAQVNAAGAYAQEAIQSLNLANDKLDETRRIGMEAGGENPGDTMRAYMRAMEIAQEEIAKAISSINTGLDFGQAYIQRLYS